MSKILLLLLSVFVISINCGDISFSRLPKETQNAFKKTANKVYDDLSTFEPKDGLRYIEVFVFPMRELGPGDLFVFGRTYTDINALATIPADDKLIDEWCKNDVTHSTEYIRSYLTFRFTCSEYHSKDKDFKDFINSWGVRVFGKKLELEEKLKQKYGLVFDR